MGRQIEEKEKKLQFNQFDQYSLSRPSAKSKHLSARSRRTRLVCFWRKFGGEEAI